MTLTLACRDISFVTLRKSGGAGVKKSQPLNERERFDILRGVSFVAQPGRLMAIMGASGSGKTSLLNVIGARSRNAIQPPDALRPYSEAQEQGLRGPNAISTNVTPLMRRRIKKAPMPYGQIFMNGEQCSTADIKAKSQYVMQQDCLLPFLSVEETITFAAKLKLPGLPSAKRMERVAMVIQELGLESCRTVLVGDTMKKGISGGQKKRVSIAIELLDDPDLLFLDEPTSGLDASLAFDVMRTVATLCKKKNKTIIATIHQPRRQIFNLFDDLLLLTGGTPIYLGPASEILTFFASCGVRAPAHYDSADFCLDVAALCVSDEARRRKEEEEEAELKNSSVGIRGGSFLQVVTRGMSREGSLVGASGRPSFIPGSETANEVMMRRDSARRSGSMMKDGPEEPSVTLDRTAEVLCARINVPVKVAQGLPAKYRESPWAARVSEQVESAMHMTTEGGKQAGTSVNEFRGNAWWSFMRNTMTCTHRAFLNKWRNPVGIVMSLMVMGLMALLMGLVYFKFEKPKKGEVDCLRYFNVIGALAFGGISNTMGTMQQVITFPLRRPQFNRESAAGLYHPLAYYLGLVIGEIGFIILPCFAHWAVFFWMADFGTDNLVPLYYLLGVCCIAWAASGAGQTMAILSPNTVVASTISLMPALITMLLSGLWINEADLPAFWSPFKYLSWIRYFLNGTLTQKYPRSLTDACAPVPNITPWENLGIIIAIGVIWRILSYLALVYTNRRVGLEA